MPPSPVWDRTGHASPGCRPQASVACGAPGERWARRVVLEGPRGAGTRTESILPRRLRLWMLAVVVERPAKAPLGFGEASRRPGCRGTAPLLQASGSETPWRNRAADSRWRLVLDVPGLFAMAPGSPTQQPLLCRRRRVFATQAYLVSVSPSADPQGRARTPTPGRRRRLLLGKGESHARQLPALAALPSAGWVPASSIGPAACTRRPPPCGRSGERISWSR